MTFNLYLHGVENILSGNREFRPRFIHAINSTSLPKRKCGNLFKSRTGKEY